MTQTLRNCQPNVGYQPHHHIYSVTLSYTDIVLDSHSMMSGSPEQRDSKWEGEQSTRWNMWTRLQLSRYAHYWQHRDRRRGNLFNEVFKVGWEEGQGWVFLCSVRLFCLLSLTAQSSDGMYIPAYSWYPSMWGDGDVDNVDRETGPGSTDVNTRLWELSARSHPCHWCHQVISQ